MFQQNVDSLSPQVLQYPGNEAKFRSDKNKHRRPNSLPLIWGVHPLVLVARLIFRAGKFWPRPETIFHLQWTKYICIASPLDVDLHAGFIWQNAIPDIGGRRCHQGDICTPERGPIPQSTNPPPNHLSQYHISLLSQYGQKVTKELFPIITFIIKRVQYSDSIQGWQ